MFGEKPIIGETVTEIDKYGRIKLPEFTFVEPGEKLFIVRVEGRYLVYKAKTYYQNIKATLSAAEKCDDLKERRELIKLADEQYRDIVKSVKVTNDKNLNVNVNKVNIFGKSSEMILKGEGNCLVLKKKMR